MSADPHAFRGAHPTDGGVVIRTVRPAARQVTVYVKDKAVAELEPADTDGLFEGVVPRAQAAARLRARGRLRRRAASFRIEDPYRFAPTVGELDLHLAGEGRHEEIYARLGAHVIEHEGVDGHLVRGLGAGRAVGLGGRRLQRLGRAPAPDALARLERDLGGLPARGRAGTSYKYEITGPDGDRFEQGRPVRVRGRAPAQDRLGGARARARVARRRSGSSSATRARRSNEPMSVYEVHLGSWRLNPLEDNRSLTYLELADELAAYAKDMGFTHLELLPVMHHPFSGSWGYQVTGYYAPSPRFGSPDDFREFVDRLHGHGLGVILDWVPAHFPRDEFALARFDGTALYEHADPRRGAHPDWGTLVFNYGRHEVRNFLVANALFWMREYHVDGIRVDAVASMLYLDYSREEGEWVPNEFGGREDLDAVSFLKELNEVLHAREPGVDLGGRGVDRVAGRLAAHLPRRPRLRLQVEHGLDARHARRTSSRTRSTAATTTTS